MQATGRTQCSSVWDEKPLEAFEQWSDTGCCGENKQEWWSKSRNKKLNEMMVAWSREIEEGVQRVESCGNRTLFVETKMQVKGLLWRSSS